MIAAGLVMLVLGLALAGGAVAVHRRASRLAKTAQVQGTISGYERQFTGKTKAYFPEVSFQTLEGGDIKTVVPQGRIFSPPKVGKPVRVIYEPARPTDAYIYAFGARYSGIIFLIIGLGIAGFGVVVMVAAGSG
jgi:Protein of unknown function (DUF3592)